MRSPREFVAAIAAAIENGDQQALRLLADELIDSLRSLPNPFPDLEAERIMFLLRSNADFTLLQRTGDALILNGAGSFAVYRQCAQALIELKNYQLAIMLLTDLVAKTDGDQRKKAIRENTEARGLLGRVYKQLFVESTRPVTPFTIGYLTRALDFYKREYDKDKTKNLWHGINTASLLYLARLEDIGLPGMPEPAQIAKEILAETDELQANGEMSAWDHATAAEALVVRDQWDDALQSIRSYLRDSDIDAFYIGSTQRQFKEILRLANNPKASALLSELERGSNARACTPPPLKSMAGDGYEKVFGPEKYKTLEWYETGLTRSKMVARIGKGTSPGSGTGFLLKGSVLSDRLNDDFVLVTNAHVISNDEAELTHPTLRAYRPSDVCILFEKSDPKKTFELQSEIFWSSGRNKLDTTIVQFHPDCIGHINEIGKNGEPFPMARQLPLRTDTEMVYVIGHPNGGTLSFSISDNALLDYEEPLIHYRSPTDPGSSGSPIFDNQWKLLGLHHKGSKTLRKLNNKEGTYEANEGLWIQSIIQALKKEGK